MPIETIISRDELVQRLKALEPQLRERGVTSLAMFGSRARGDARPDSDLDLLIEVEDDAKFSLINLVQVERVISEDLGVEAIATSRDGLSEKVRKRIADDIVEVFP